MSQSQKMRSALFQYVIPNLTANGFVGTYPHYKKIYADRIELLTFQTNNWGNSFLVEISTAFLPGSKRKSNTGNDSFEDLDALTTWDTNMCYRLKGMYDGWFYYTDLYRHKMNGITFYNAVSETKAKTYVPAEGEERIQKADADIYRKVCEEVNRQMPKAFKWWDAFNKKRKLKLKLLDKF